MNKPSLRIAVLALVLLAPVAGGAQEVSGSFKTTGFAITPTHVCAYPVRASWNPEREGIAVLLSEGPVDAAAAVQALDPHTHALNQDSLDDKNYVTINIWPSGTVAMNATKSEGMVQYVDNTNMQLLAELTTNTAEEVAGRVWTEKPVELLSGETYTVDLSFATKITRPPPGESLGEGGGAPGTALTALVAAARAGDWPAMAALLPDDYIERTYCWFDSAEPTEEDLLECALESLPNWITGTEQEVEILGGVDRGETAVLEVKQASSGLEILNLAKMHKTQDGWVFERSSVVGMY